MNRFRSDAEDAMCMDICFESAQKIKDKEEGKTKKINMPKVLPKSPTKKDQPKKQRDLRSIKECELKIDFKSSKMSR